MMGGDGLWLPLIAAMGELRRFLTAAMEDPWWLPIAAVALMAVVGLLAARARPRKPARRGWVAGVLLLGVAAVASTAWQQAATRATLRQQIARLEDFESRLGELGRLLPQGPSPSASPVETFDSVGAAIRSLNARIADLEEQVRAAQEKYGTRSIDPETAAKLAEHLRRFGRHRAVVSTVPDDVEAFTYANQIANILREAGWEALGPETTLMFGTPPSTGITLFARYSVAPPEALRVLTDAFTRFNIPYRSGVTPSEAIPDPATVELFVSRKS